MHHNLRNLAIDGRHHDVVIARRFPRRVNATVPAPWEGRTGMEGVLFLWEPVLTATVKELALKQPLATLKLTTSAHGAEACVVGTVALVLDDILRHPVL